VTADAGLAPPRLRVEDLTVRYGDRTALQRVSLEVRAGEFVALTGPNGSGKSSLLRAALGLVPAAGGSVRLAGAPVGELSVRERARRVAWVPQEEIPRDNVRVLEYALFGRYAHVPPFARESSHDRALAWAALRDADLADRAASGVLELSGGERQRLLLARALLQSDRLLLLDEPTAHLDIGHELDLLDRVRRRVRSSGGAVLAAMHDLNLAARFADRIVVLSRGRRIEDGPPAEVLTPALLREVWGVDADLRRDPRHGLPYLVPHLPGGAERPRAHGGRGPVHVVGGGGAAAPIFRALVDAGYRLTAGTLHLLDSDAQAAGELGIPFAAEVPFAPIGPEARAENRRLLDAARAIVVAPFALGPSNLANLEDLLPFLGRTPILLVAGAGVSARDFAGGAGAALWERLRAGGAHVVASPPPLLEELDRSLAGAPA
jgi:cobalamin transport system ATP-binding protein